MKSVNKVTLLGRVGGDPEVRYTQNNTPIATVSIATSYSTKNDSGGYDEHTDWHKVTAWGGRAEVMQNWVKKGQLLYIEGRLKPGKYVDKDGVERYKIDIVVDDLVLLGSKRDGDSNGAQSQAQKPTNTPNTKTGPASEFDDLSGDDLPF